MEDRDVALQRLVGADLVTFLAVYDGHGGAHVADRAATHLHERVFPALERGGTPEDALRGAYADVDRGLADAEHVGSTAATVAIVDRRVVAAWVGDSQIIAGADGAVRFVSPAHRLDDAAEHARVVAAGAEIDRVYVMRGQYGVMVTRALGDTWLRPVGVVATPSTATIDLNLLPTPFVAIASDGLWDVLSADEVAHVFVTHGAERGFDYARALVDRALAAGTRDNVTVVTATW